MQELIIDFETRSELDLKKVGIWRYVEHRSTQILCFAVRLRGGVRDRSGLFYDPERLPDWLVDALADPAVTIHAHNAAVERLIMKKICSKRHGWPKVAASRYRCSAARIARMAIPRSLEKGGKALGVDIQKDKEGHRLMLRLCKPLAPRKGETVKGFVFDNDPAKLQRVGEYCMTDVDSEEAVIDATFPMPEGEEELYQMTERINDRGVQVDTDLVKRLIWQANECVEGLNARIDKLTGGRVRALTEVAKIKQWIEDETGVVLKTMRKEDMEDLIAPEGVSLPKHVKDVLKIRQEGAKSSVAKLLAILNRVADDGRIRHAFVFNGASTGRYTSMGVQLQNLVRDTHKDFDEAIKRLEEFTLTEISKTIRGCFIAKHGCVFVDADYNAIEARGVGWLAGAKKLVRIYEMGGDPYCEMGTVIYSRKITKADESERFVGKQTILGCGYGMGAAKFFAQCVKFGKEVPMDVAEKAIDAYRTEFEEIPQLWRDMEQAAIAAVRNPGRTTEIPNGKIQFRVLNGYLQMRLPSGHRLFYKDAKVKKVDKWGNGREQWELSYMAEHPINKQWVRESTWGGKLTENAVQAICRDLLFRAMYILEYEYGIPIVLSVHDQIVAEVPESDGPWALKVVKKVMESLPPWAKGFPVMAEPKITTRFGK